MSTIGKRLLGLLLILMVAIPLGCVNINDGPREHRSERHTEVGGRHGVVVDRSDSGTDVKVGGDHGVVVDHPRD